MYKLRRISIYSSENAVSKFKCKQLGIKILDCKNVLAVIDRNCQIAVFVNIECYHVQCHFINNDLVFAVVILNNIRSVSNSENVCVVSVSAIETVVSNAAVQNIISGTAIQRIISSVAVNNNAYYRAWKTLQICIIKERIVNLTDDEIVKMLAHEFGHCLKMPHTAVNQIIVSSLNTEGFDAQPDFNYIPSASGGNAIAEYDRARLGKKLY